MEKQYQYNSVEEALEELRRGRIVLVTDDPDRENEGDMICAAEFATQENINFMACHAKGLICTPMSAALAGRLGLSQMVSENTDNHSTAFTVSVDHVDTTTGISAAERGYTMRSLTEEGTKPQDLRRPGHVFPLVARHGGVLVRNGHTEATVDLMRLAGLKECGICCEIMEEDGTMMRTENLWKLAKKYDLKFITIKDLQDYCRIHEKHVVREACAKMPTQYGEFQIYWRWGRCSVPCTFRVPDRRYFRISPLRLWKAAAVGDAADRERRKRSSSVYATGGKGNRSDQQAESV